MSMLGAVTTLREQVEQAQLPLDIPEVMTGRPPVTPSSSSSTTTSSRGCGRSTHRCWPSWAAPPEPASRPWSTRSSTPRSAGPGCCDRPPPRPVLVHHPEDARWFSDDRVLPSLSRVTGAPSEGDGGTALRLVRRARSRRAWRCSTPPTSTRWSAPTGRSRPSCSPPPTCGCSSRPRPATPTPCRGTCCARPPSAAPPSRSCSTGCRPRRWPTSAATWRRCCASRDCPPRPSSASPRRCSPREGRLPEQDVARLRSWLTALASDARARSVIVKQTLDGALGSLDERAGVLVDGDPPAGAGRDRAAPRRPTRHTARRWPTSSTA